MSTMALTGWASVAGASGDSPATGPKSLTAAMLAIENQRRYDHATWGYEVQGRQVRVGPVATQARGAAVEDGRGAKVGRVEAPFPVG